MAMLSVSCLKRPRRVISNKYKGCWVRFLILLIVAIWTGGIPPHCILLLDIIGWLLLNIYYSKAQMYMLKIRGEYIVIVYLHCYLIVIVLIILAVWYLCIMLVHTAITK